jgi:predicted acetyltransferase
MVGRLWLMFRHEMSEFTRQLPNPDGTYRTERLDSAFEKPDWACYVFTDPADRPAGFAIARDLGSPVQVLTSFFVAKPARRTRVGLQAATAVIAEHPGRWEIAFQDANTAAVRFWRRVAEELAGDDWKEEHRPVPGLPELPPDSWIAFDVGPRRLSHQA